MHGSFLIQGVYYASSLGSCGWSCFSAFYHMQWFPFLSVLIIIIGYLPHYDTGFKVYGPKGIAQLLTSILSITSTFIASPIEIYEFLHPGETLSGSCFCRCLFEATGSGYSISVNAIYPDADGYWTVFSVFLPVFFSTP